jgi:glycerol transport system ATP-binding protein
MIYVTHDQTEALTFADQVVVMVEGQVVQAGTPVELFERPRHTFVGYFIGSPGMNLLPCEVDAAGVARYAGIPIETANGGPVAANGVAGKRRLEIGVRPEFVRFADEGVPVTIERVADAGRYRVVHARHREQSIKALVGEGGHVPEREGRVRFQPDRTQIYADSWIVE